MGGYSRAACLMVALAATVAACATQPPLLTAAAPPTPTSTVTTRPPTTSPTTTRARTPTTPSRRARPAAADTVKGCGQRAVTAGTFNPACREYQGYLDPGTTAGRAPTSGELQQEYGCAHGLIPKSDC